MAALSDDEGLLSQLFQYRFGRYETSTAGFGNLYLTAMTAITGSFEARWKNRAGAHHAVRHAVVSLARVVLSAEVRGTDGSAPADRVTIVRESNIGATGGASARVYLEPENPPAYPGAIRAILDANLIVIGPEQPLHQRAFPTCSCPTWPGHRRCTGRQVYVCNVAPRPARRRATA